MTRYLPSYICDCTFDVVFSPVFVPQGRVFFVDHSTATTTWDDPRLAMQHTPGQAAGPAVQPMVEGLGSVAMYMQQLQQMQESAIGWGDGTEAMNILKSMADDLTSCNNDPAMIATVCREMEMVGGVTLLCRFLHAAVTAATVGSVSAEGVQAQACRALANCLELRKTQPAWEECGRALRMPWFRCPRCGEGQC